jgi:uncharacterized FlgJ-related protein
MALVPIFLAMVLNIGHAESLPDLPEHLSNSFSDANKLNMDSAVDLQHFFTEKHYDIYKVSQSRQLPDIFVANLPPDLNALQVHDKTSLFIRLLLTSVVKVNESILAVRNEIKHLPEKKGKGSSLTKVESEWLANIAEDYYCEATNLSELINRVDILPVGLVLAQAIDESGWGTSHFAREGNALYGQHLGAHSKATYLTTPDGKVKIATYDNLYHSTAGYLHNINTTKAYGPLREARAPVRVEHGHLYGNKLAGTLVNYSVRGPHYVKTLRWLIQHYKLDELNNLTFINGDTSDLIVFPQATLPKK